jgi:hypothetical protein
MRLGGLRWVSGDDGSTQMADFPTLAAWHILFILIGVASVLIAIRHDDVVKVSFPRRLSAS